MAEGKRGGAVRAVGTGRQRQAEPKAVGAREDAGRPAACQRACVQRPGRRAGPEEELPSSLCAKAFQTQASLPGAFAVSWHCGVAGLRTGVPARILKTHPHPPTASFRSRS